eukprot:CAMPEP_0113546886 /NCGR_PEP_ID=MMETSP0015_2-20120614/12052_1 /TAXON_ID=2838 /ORGANISM="Odontella" /LENGTH=475 /DNA_ID=CAMNT_0000447385 /DNA_START=67 /DNA_END=1494 /DNA_ORIENTATION=- /assembly_acc=CAM_ASM_000160
MKLPAPSLILVLIVSDVVSAYIPAPSNYVRGDLVRVAFQPTSPHERGGVGSALGESADPLKKWFLSEFGSLDISEGEKATSAAVSLGRGSDPRFVDSPASLDVFSVVASRPATRRDWLGAASASAATVAAASSWSFRPGLASASEVPTKELSTSAASLCDPSITTFRNPSTGRVVHILGTAHISTDSAQLAGRVVRDIRPDAVFVELDRKRIAGALPKGDDAPSGGPGAGDNIRVGLTARGGAGDGSAVVNAVDGLAEYGTDDSVPQQQEQSRRGAFGNPIQQARERVMTASTKAVGGAIKGMYSKLGDQGFNPGEEFILAIREAMAVNAVVVLGDRDVDVTLRRLTEALAKTDIKKLLSSDSELEQALKNVMPDDMKNSMDGDGSKMTKDQLSAYVETVKARENVRVIMSQLKLNAPELYQAMVAERDSYMARGLDSLDKYGTTVAVMGIAHVDGVEGNLIERGWEQISVCPAK